MPDVAPAAQASGDDFSSWAVDDLMPLYYSASACVCGLFDVHEPGYCAERDSITDNFQLASAERIFPHADFYKWLSYGNGMLNAVLRPNTCPFCFRPLVCSCLPV